MPYNVFSKKNMDLRSEQEETIEQKHVAGRYQIVDAQERDTP